MLYIRYRWFLQCPVNMKCSLKVTKEQSTCLEANTREQSGSKLWFTHRAGRITASNFKAAAVTNSCMPSQSLISRLYYPENHKFSTTATRYLIRILLTLFKHQFLKVGL